MKQHLLSFFRAIQLTFLLLVATASHSNAMAADLAELQGKAPEARREGPEALRQLAAEATDAGIKLHKKKNYRDALALFIFAHETDPQFPKAVYNGAAAASRLLQQQTEASEQKLTSAQLLNFLRLLGKDSETIKRILKDADFRWLRWDHTFFNTLECPPKGRKEIEEMLLSSRFIFQPSNSQGDSRSGEIRFRKNGAFEINQTSLDLKSGDNLPTGLNGKGLYKVSGDGLISLMINRKHFRAEFEDQHRQLIVHGLAVFQSVSRIAE